MAGGRGNRLFSQGLGHNENCCATTVSALFKRGIRMINSIGLGADPSACVTVLSGTGSRVVFLCGFGFRVD